MTTIHSRQILQLQLRVLRSRVTISARPSVRNVSTVVPQNPSPRLPRWMRRLIYAGVFGAIGMEAGKMIDKMVAVPPDVGSPEDEMKLQKIEHAFDIALPIVQELRNDPEWVETGVYGDFSDESKIHRLTSGPLSGSRGLGLQVSLSELCVPSGIGHIS